MHTGHSDGAGSAAEIVEACHRLGLDFAVVTDHDSLALRDRGEEGWHDGVLLAVGNEISTRKNFTHLLGLNVTEAAPRLEHGVHGALEYVNAKGGHALLAHAHGRGLGGRGYSRRNWPWWPHPLLRGAEVWNYLQDWGRTFRLWEPASYRLDRVPGRIAGPPRWVLEYWDAEAERRPFSGIAGNDNHAKRLWPFRKKYWPHQEMLGRMVNRVRLDLPLSKDGSEAARQVMNALAGGRCVFARDELASSEGFDLRTEEPRKSSTTRTSPTVLRPGDTAPFEPGITLVVQSPVEAELRICRLGVPVASATGTKLQFSPEGPGAYRAEARLPLAALPGRLAPAAAARNATAPWAFSNHIRLT